MSKAAWSLFVFAIYVIVMGLVLLIAPTTIIHSLGLPELTRGWTRVVGLLAVVIGTYDIVGARSHVREYVRASVYVRLGFASGIALVVLSGEMPLAALPLGMIDLVGAVWTALALRSATPVVVQL
jgi:hypothetical protein